MTLRVIKGGEHAPTQLGLADYVWVDPNGKLGVKTRAIAIADSGDGVAFPLIQRCTAMFPDPDHPRSDRQLILSPCNYLPDPLRPQPSYVTLCEVRNLDDEVVHWNQRAKLRDRSDDIAQEKWGIRQRFRLTTGSEMTDPSPDAYLVAERHLGACLDAGLLVHSARLDHPKGVWSFNVGDRGFPTEIDPEKATALVVADHLWIARYLLDKVARERGLLVEYGSDDGGAWPMEVFFSDHWTRTSSHEVARIATRLSSCEHALWFRPHASAVRQGYECIEGGGHQATDDPYAVVLSVLDAIIETDRMEKA